MNRPALAVCLAVVLLSVAAFKKAELQTSQALKSLAISEDALKNSAWNAFAGGGLFVPSVTKFKQLATGDRSGMVRDAVVFAKSYVQTDDFTKKYLSYRESKKPQPPQKSKTMAEQKADHKASLEKSLKESEENLKKASPDMKKIFQNVVDMTRQQLKELDNPNHPLYGNKQMDAMLQQAYADGMEIYKQQLATWETEYPANAAPMIHKWLNEFLNATQDIDYSASLTTNKYNQKVFANPAYEGKSREWKMCFRAGREVVEAGRAEAKKWLQELSSPN
jgi:hypothetical protein